MDLSKEVPFLNSLGLFITVVGKDLKKCHQGSNGKVLFVIITTLDRKLYYKDTLPKEDHDRVKKWMRCEDPTGLTAEWKEISVSCGKQKTWKAYFAGEEPGVDCSSVMNEMFVNGHGENYTYALKPGYRLVKITHPESFIALHDFSIPGGLSIEEQEVYHKILEVAQAYKASHRQAPHVMTITDLAKDYDDLTAMLILKELHRFGLIHLDGFVANLAPPRRRAIYGRGALDFLGLQAIPIGVGEEATTKPRKPRENEFGASFMPDEKTFIPDPKTFFENGSELLGHVFTRAVKNNRKITLLLISSLTDIDKYTEANLETFQQRVEKVYLQGGYSVSADNTLIPHGEATNNRFDMSAAEKFHGRLENIPSVAYTKIAAYATEIPAKIFDDLEATGHSIGKCLQQQSKEQGVDYYETACGPNPFGNMTQEKFLHDLSTFYKSHPPGSKEFAQNGTPLPEDETPLPKGKEIVPYLTKAIVYDALPALATGGDDLLTALDVLDKASMKNQESIHKVVGTPKLEENLPDISNIKAERMALVISAILKGALFNVMEQ